HRPRRIRFSFGQRDRGEHFTFAHAALAARVVGKRLDDLYCTIQISSVARPDDHLIALRVERHMIRRSAARRVRIAESFLDVREMAMQRTEHGLRHARFGQRDRPRHLAVGFAVAHASTAAASARSPTNEPCDAETMRTCAMTPLSSDESWKCTPCKYG